MRKKEIQGRRYLGDVQHHQDKKDQKKPLHKKENVRGVRSIVWSISTQFNKNFYIFHIHKTLTEKNQCFFGGWNCSFFDVILWMPCPTAPSGRLSRRDFERSEKVSKRPSEETRGEPRVGEIEKAKRTEISGRPNGRPRSGGEAIPVEAKRTTTLFR